MNLSSDELKNLASQLRCPNGAAGLEVAEQMNQTNYGMTMSTILYLELKPDDVILEIGHGNALHLADIFNLAPSLKYSGLDISLDMKKEAERINENFVKNDQAAFFHYEGQSFPFEEAVFDKILTVNTLYFWENPSATLNEIYRVLKPGGLCNITYSHKDFMKNLPFTEFGFQLYNDEDVLTLIEKSKFKHPEIRFETEQVNSKNGEFVNRTYSILSILK